MAIVLRRDHALTHQDKSSTDESALFESLLERHQARLYRVAYRMAGNHDEAQDLLQDAVVEAYRAFASFRQGTYFDRWLYRIMTRTFIDRQRVRKRTRTESLDVPLGGDSDYGARELPDSENDPGSMVERNVLAEPIERALASLAPDFRLVIILADIEEMSYEDIAAAINCPVGTVRSRLHRARLHVKNALSKAGYSPYYS